MNFEKPQNNKEVAETPEEQIREKEGRIKAMMAFGDLTPQDREIIKRLKDEIGVLKVGSSTYSETEHVWEIDADEIETLDTSEKNISLDGLDISGIRNGIKEDSILKHYYSLAKEKINSETGKIDLKRGEVIKRTYKLVSESGDTEAMLRLENILRG